MSFTYISNRPAPVSWKQWLLVAALGFFALSLLRYHIYYLSHLDVTEWSFRYLQLNRLNHDFEQRMRRAKMVVCVIWMGALAFGWKYSQTMLLHNHIEPYAPAVKRMGMALFLFLFTVVNYDPPDVELSFFFFVNSVAFAALAFALYRLPYSRMALCLLGKGAIWLKEIPTPLLCASVALFIFTTSWQLGAAFFSHLPLTVDTSAQLVHAKIMGAGHWTMKSHPLPRFFDMYMMINNGKWFSQYPPGHVMLLALGTLLKARTYVNPLLGAFTSLAIFGLAKELYGLRVARYAVVLSGMCVYLLLMSSEFMSNATSLLMGTLFLWAYFRMLKKPHWKTGMWGGMAIGYCFITRPYTTLALAVPYMAYSVFLLLVRKRIYGQALKAMALAGMAFVLFQLYYNKVTTGHAFTFGYQLSWGDWHNPFTPEASDRLNEWELVKNFRENMQRTGWFNRLTFEWPVPSLILLVFAYAWRGNRRNERLLFLTILSFFMSCQILPGNVEREWGPRLCYEILCILVVLSAKALSVMPAFLRLVCSQRRSLAYYYGFAVMTAVGFYGFASAHNLKPETLTSIYNFSHRGNNPSFYKYVVRNVQPPALVFVTGEIYQAVSFTNPPMEDSPIVFANDWGKDDKELMHFYPDRNIYHAFVGRMGYHVDRVRPAMQRLEPPMDKPGDTEEPEAPPERQMNDRPPLDKKEMTEPAREHAREREQDEGDEPLNATPPQDERREHAHSRGREAGEDNKPGEPQAPEDEVRERVRQHQREQGEGDQPRDSRPPKDDVRGHERPPVDKPKKKP